MGGIGLYLLPQTQDIDVDRTIRNGAVVAPHGVQQLFAAVDDAWTAHQEVQKAKLCGGQRDLASPQEHPATGAIKLQSAGADGARGDSLSPQLIPDAGDQLPNEEGLYNVVIRTQFQAQDAVSF